MCTEILIFNLVVVTIVVERRRMNFADILLSSLLGVVQLAAVIDCILIVTHHPMRLLVLTGCWQSWYTNR